MKVRVLIQSRISSRRLPAKALLSFYEMPLIVAIVKRISGFSDDIRVCTSNSKNDDLLCRILKRRKIKFFRGSEKNVLRRFYESSVDLNDSDTVVRLTADNPLPDKYFLNKMMSIWKKQKNNILCAWSKTNNLPIGLSAEFIRVKLIREAFKNAKSKYDKEHVTPYIKRNYQCSYLPKEKNKIKIKSFTIDKFEDYVKVFNLMKADDKKNLLLKWNKFI